LPGRPTHDLFLDLAYTIGPARLRYGVDVMSGMETDLQGQIPVPSRVLQGAGLTLEVPGVRGLTATFDVRNLFDVRAGEVPSVLGGRDRIPLGDAYEYPLPGRRFLLALAWRTR
jgi:vitamin B12 transporter